MVNLESSLLPAIGLISTAISNFNTFPFSPGFSIKKVATLAESLPSHSWEYGTFAQALLELYNPEISIFGLAPFPVPNITRDRVRSLSYVADKVRWGDGYDALDSGNDAAGDPSSMGVSAVLLGKTEPRFAQATDDTVRGLLEDVPRFWNGAISHRANVAELWSDFMYMVPPFLAYYAADKGDAKLLQDTVSQCRDYRQVLQFNTTQPYKGLWMHIIGPENTDEGLWATGNAWAAAGMSRVLATVIKSPFSANLPWRQQAIKDLTQYIKEILDGAMNAPTDNGLLRNYLNDLDASGRGFGEISGSSLLAATAYRMAVLQPQVFGQKYTSWADGIRKVLCGDDANSQPHITDTGLATPAVNPLGWLDTNPYTAGSPEGQSFVVLMYTGWRDCLNARKCQVPTGGSGAGPVASAGPARRDTDSTNTKRKHRRHLSHGSTLEH